MAFCMAFVSLHGTPASAECPRRESTETFTGGKVPIRFQHSSRYESVTFLTQGAVRSRERTK